MEREIYQKEWKNTNVYLTVLFLLFLSHFFSKPSAFPTLAFFPLYWFCIALLQWEGSTTEASSASFGGAIVTKSQISLEKNYFRFLLDSEKNPKPSLGHLCCLVWRAMWTYRSIWFIKIQQDTLKSSGYDILSYKHRRKQFLQYN